MLQIGPLDLAYFEKLLPNSPLLRELVSLVRAFVGFEVGFAVNPVLAHDAVPPLRLPSSVAAATTTTMDAAAGAGPLLGWNTWLPTSAMFPRRMDADDAVFEGEVVEGHS